MTIEQRVAQLERNRCCGKPKYYDTFEDFPQPGATNTLYVDRETGSIYIWTGEGYIKAGAEDPLFLFQVGVPGYGHIHWAPLTTTQAQFLIQNTNSTFPVADELQPFVVITAETNGTPENEHQHDLTVYFDYESHTFVVTDITNNELDNHEAHLIGTAGGGALLGFDTMDDAIFALGLGKQFYYLPTNLEGATPGSVHITI